MAVATIISHYAGSYETQVDAETAALREQDSGSATCGTGYEIELISTLSSGAVLPQYKI
jgi:hypothetical protein